MAITEFTKEQEIALTRCLIKMSWVKQQLKNIDEQLYSLGSFSQSPVGYMEQDVQNGIDYIKSWLNEGGVVID